MSGVGGSMAVYGACDAIVSVQKQADFNTDRSATLSDFNFIPAPFAKKISILLFNLFFTRNIEFF